LPIDALDRHETHRRLPSGDGDGLGVRRVILAAFAERNDKLGSNQPCRVAARGKPAAPVMGRTTRFHDHIARRQLFCPPFESIASKNPSFKDRTVAI
jgi:hypothetical protein